MNDLMQECFDACSNVRKVFLAYNANIDAILHINKIKKKAALFSSRARYITEISEPGDLFSGIMYAMKNGEGIEIGMHEGIEKWLKKNIRPEKKRMGGQTGIMANHLALLGIRPLVYTPLLSEEQIKFFRSSVVFVQKKKSEDTKVNWIFEFNKGDQLGRVTAKLSNRFIASSRRDDFRMKPVNLDFHFDSAILSGFQSVKREYRDGTTYKDLFEVGKNVAKRIKEMGRNLHYELSYTPDRKINKCLLDLAVLSDSVGMDEEDLINALKTLGKGSLAEKLHRSHDIKYILQGITFLSSHCGAKIHLHGRGYYLAASRDYHIKPEYIKKSMEFASAVAATYAQQIVRSREDLEKGIKIGHSGIGENKKKEIGELLSAQASETREGIFKRKGYDIICVPFRAAKKVVDVVGLGDIISSSIFACETGFALKSRQ